MKTNKKAGIVLAVAGAVLLMAALLFALYNEYVDIRAGTASERILEEFRSVLEKQTENAPAQVLEGAQSPDTDSFPDSKITHLDTPDSTPVSADRALTVEGYNCIGYLEIPILGLTLPVLDQWDYEQLNAAPCRHFGSVYTDDLVIAGHNYKRHFSYLTKLKPGDAVYFCDAGGVLHNYSVESVRYIDASNVDAVKDSDCPLVLYTCTFMGDIRAAVFCSRTEE